MGRQATLVQHLLLPAALPLCASLQPWTCHRHACSSVQTLPTNKHAHSFIQTLPHRPGSGVENAAPVVYKRPCHRINSSSCAPPTPLGRVPAWCAVRGFPPRAHDTRRGHGVQQRGAVHSLPPRTCAHAAAGACPVPSKGVECCGAGRAGGGLGPGRAGWQVWAGECMLCAGSSVGLVLHHFLIAWLQCRRQPHRTLVVGAVSAGRMGP